MFDKERTGHIAASELRMIFAALPERLSDMEIDEMLRAADRDGNSCFLKLTVSRDFPVLANWLSRSPYTGKQIGFC